MTRTRILALATLILLVAAFLRIWQLAIYPPGPHYDEAAELLIARSIAFGGARFFPMVEAYQGREVLFYYLSAPLLALVHDGVFSLRVLSVFCSVITIAASMALGRAMFPGRRGVVVGLAVGVLMTLSFPMIWTARQAFRSSSLPMMQALALLVLWHGLRAHRRAPLQLLVAGVLAGGAVYTYNASRLFPFWLLVGGAALLWFDRAHWRRRLGQGAVFFGSLAVTAAPMAIYAFQRPDVFWGRLAEVTQPNQSVTLAQSIVLHLKLFFIAGDPYFRYNIAGRPYFTLPEGALLLVGIGVAAYRLTRRITATERAAYLLALLSPLMVIPSVISVGGLPPNFLRSLGMVPLIFVLVGVGAEWVIARAERWLAARNSAFVGAHRRAPLPVLLFVALLLLGGYLAADLYFGWASSAALYYETDADLAVAARWLVDQHIEGEPVYLAARDKGHPTVMIEPVPPITWLGTDSLFVPPPGVTGLYIFPHSAPPPADWVAWLAPGAITGLPLAPDGQPAFQAFRIAGDAPLPVDSAAFFARNQYLTLVGYDTPTIPAGSSGELVMAWQISTPPPYADFTPLVQIEDRHGSLIYRGDVYMAGTDEWRGGETLIQRMTVAIPPATPPGDYRVRIAWVGRASDQYVPYIEDGASGAVWAEIGTLTVTRPAAFPNAAALSMDVRQPTEVAPGVVLLGWDAPAASLRLGEALTPTLYWQATGAARAAFTLRAVLRGASGDTLLWSGKPIDDRYSADQWVEGEVLADPVRWTIPREQPAGDYALALLVGSEPVALGQVTVTGVARLFDLPPVASMMNVNFGDVIQLIGYTLTRHDGILSLEIVWRASDNIAADYKVFVHLVGLDGVIITQRDSMPKSDTYPTSLWVRDEYVVDTYDFPAPDAGFVFRVGLYSPEDGGRLPVLDAAHRVVGDFVEIAP